MIRGAARQHAAPVAGQSAHEAAVEPQGHHPRHGVGRQARTDVAEPGQERRPHQVVVPNDGSPVRQALLDAAQLPPVEHLAVREMDIGDAEFAEIDHLAHPVEHRAGGKLDGLRGRGEGRRAPDREAVNASGHLCPGVVAADLGLQGLDILGRLLHQHEVGLFALDQRRDAGDIRPDPSQEIPADDLAKSGPVLARAPMGVLEGTGSQAREAAIVQHRHIGGSGTPGGKTGPGRGHGLSRLTTP
ncbi:hypothetical protein ASF58_00730 [Methylobacterium sp. Leaf125]|nr:hypothetical protein ASF58_00730 [Methylobacterium sp. Leaf125]